MKAVLVKASLDLIAEMLQVPDGVRLERVVEELDSPGTVTLKLVGDGLPDKFLVNVNGALIQRAEPKLRVVKPFEPAGAKVEWEWPE